MTSTPRPLDRQELSAPFTATDALAATRVCSVGGLLGESMAMQVLSERIARAAAMHGCVLLTGETGSGKELAARCLHTLSARASEPFVVLDCSATPAALIESELFGREASEEHAAPVEGCVERAGDGTLLLKEIQELSIAAQLRLLEAIESRRMRRIGSGKDLPVRCRLIATLQEDLQRKRLQPELRERLSGCTIAVPALRDREEDAEVLARYFLAVLNAEEGTAKRLSPRSLVGLQQYSWPGNVRELRYVVHRAFAAASDDVDITAAIDHSLGLSSPGDTDTLHIPVGTALAEAERWMIFATLKKCQGNKTRAAALLGISLKTLYNRLNAYRAQGLEEGDIQGQSVEVTN